MIPTHDTISAAENMHDEIYDEKVKGVDAIFAYANAKATLLDNETNKRLLRKIDTRVLPWLCGLYILQYLDKGVLNYASVMSLLTEAHLTSHQFTWLGSIYYLGYIAALVPHNRTFQYVMPSKYIDVCMMLRGLVLTTMVACNSFKSLMIQRVFLGTLEAVVNCGFVLVTAAWNRKYEHGGQVSLWASCNGLATIVGGLIAYGCVAGQEKSTHMKVASWKIMALCLGLVSIAYGACMCTSWLAPCWRSRPPLLDLCQIPRIRQQNCSLPAIPSGALQVIFQNSMGYIADRTKQRGLSAIFIQLVTLFGASLLTGLGNLGPLYLRAGQLAAYFIMIGGCAIAYYLVLGTTEKKTTNVIFFISMAVSYLVGSQMFVDKPYYLKAKHATVGLWVVSVVVLVMMYYFNVWENRKRDIEASVSGVEPLAEGEFLDLRDRENKAFRYVV